MFPVRMKIPIYFKEGVDTMLLLLSQLAVLFNSVDVLLIACPICGLNNNVFVLSVKWE